MNVNVHLCRLLVLMFCYACVPVASAKKPYTKEEVSLAKIPKVRFHDRRLRKVFKRFARQYKHMYHNAAADGYILPNELGDLHIQRRQMKRLILIDRRNHKVKVAYYKYKRIRRRRRTTAQKEAMGQLKKRRERYEQMIRRFACRHIPKYKRRYRKTHCRKR